MSDRNQPGKPTMDTLATAIHFHSQKPEPYNLKLVVKEIDVAGDIIGLAVCDVLYTDTIKLATQQYENPSLKLLIANLHATFTTSELLDTVFQDGIDVRTLLRNETVKVSIPTLCNKIAGAKLVQVVQNAFLAIPDFFEIHLPQGKKLNCILGRYDYRELTRGGFEEEILIPVVVYFPSLDLELHPANNDHSLTPKMLFSEESLEKIWQTACELATAQTPAQPDAS